MGLPKFYVARLVEGEIELDESESTHASRVLRSQVGDDVLVFDGLGKEGFGTIRSISRRAVVVDVASIRFEPRDHQGRLAMAVAMPKGDRQRHVIEKLVELGIDHLIPIETERSVAHIDADAHGRLNRYVLESCKQSGRNRFLKIHPSLNWNAMVCDPEWLPHRRWVLHPCPTADRPAQLLNETTRRADFSNRSLLFAIGPEGGFTDEEIQLSQRHGLGLLDLGSRILRVETAVAFASVLGQLMIPTTRGDNPGPQSR
jgi:16S rRNA (uracil1498-N3)-methyltransferase